MLTNLSAARLSIQPPSAHQQQQQAGGEWRRVETVPMTLELLPQAAPNGKPAGDDIRDPESSPRRPDLVKFTIQVDSDV